MTPGEMEALKDAWRQDPCWNIEDAEGFEAHRDELLQWRLEFEAEAEEREHTLLEQRAAEHRRTVRQQEAIEQSIESFVDNVIKAAAERHGTSRLSDIDITRETS